ncbi:MLP-like protein 423, partial [Linum perenne]
EKEFTIVSSANDYWGAIFAFTEILPKAVPNYYSKINAVKGNGFSEGSIREITFFQVVATGVPLKTSDEQIIYVDHETKTVTWSVINGGMKDFYDILKITVSVEPKIKTRPRDYGCIVKWRCEAHGENSKGLNMKSMKQFVKKTFDTLDTYLLRSVVSETR